MRSEFDKKRSGEGVITGKDEATGIIILSEEPQWLVIRETESNYFELRLDQEYGYNINIVQGDDEIYDYEVGGNVYEITIIHCFFFFFVVYIDLHSTHLRWYSKCKRL